jgi:hypothetical protein
MRMGRRKAESKRERVGMMFVTESVQYEGASHGV